MRTVGYILTRVRIVNLKGERPSFFWMNVRLFLWVLAPITAVVDPLWFWGEGNRRMLRDTFAGTYVIKQGATPIGQGPIRATTLFVLGYTIVFPEVMKPLAVA